MRRKVGRLYRYQGKFVEQFVYWKMKTDPVFRFTGSASCRAKDSFSTSAAATAWRRTGWRVSLTGGRFSAWITTKTKSASRNAPRRKHPRIKFEVADILEWEYPACDTVLLLDVLHYWTPEKQQLILNKARRALRPGGRLILRDAARAESAAHRRVDRWENSPLASATTRQGRSAFSNACRVGTGAAERAGFAHWEIKPGADGTRMCCWWRRVEPHADAPAAQTP